MKIDTGMTTDMGLDKGTSDHLRKKMETATEHYQDVAASGAGVSEVLDAKLQQVYAMRDFASHERANGRPDEALEAQVQEATEAHGFQLAEERSYIIDLGDAGTIDMDIDPSEIKDVARAMQDSIIAARDQYTGYVPAKGPLDEDRFENIKDGSNRPDGFVKEQADIEESLDEIREQLESHSSGWDAVADAVQLGSESEAYGQTMQEMIAKLSENHTNCGWGVAADAHGLGSNIDIRQLDEARGYLAERFADMASMVKKAEQTITASLENGKAISLDGNSSDIGSPAPLNPMG